MFVFYINRSYAVSYTAFPELPVREKPGTSIAFSDGALATTTQDSRVLSVEWDPRNKSNILLFYERRNHQLAVAYGRFHANATGFQPMWSDETAALLNTSTPASDVRPSDFGAPFSSWHLDGCGSLTAGDYRMPISDKKDACVLAISFDPSTKMSITSVMKKSSQTFNFTKDGKVRP